MAKKSKRTAKTTERDRTDAGSKPSAATSAGARKRSNVTRTVTSRPDSANHGSSRKPASKKRAARAEVSRATKRNKVNTSDSTEAGAFPIVGIGSSAGGLEALERFLKHLPPQSGMAFVVIQHLDPHHRGSMVEILQRATSMPVRQVKDQERVRKNHVYVIPPGKDMPIMRGVLYLLPRSNPRGPNLPIDFFFRSLAEDQHELSIGVVLSGTGTDGTLGLRHIKEKAGVTFVQSLSSAQFDGMPRSAIEAGVADVVADVDELPGRIIAYSKHTPYMNGAPQLESVEDRSKSALDKVYALLRSHTGNDFSLYKKSTIHRRIERRMALHQIDKLANYVRYLREDPRETDLLFRELLIGVTSFFRDPSTWDFLKKEALAALLAARPNGSVIRAWVPGCSTGEEAYSLAIVFKEAVEGLKGNANFALQVFATDLDKDAIEKARQGLYPRNIAADVSPERLRRFFNLEERGYRVNKQIREMVVFAPQSIIMDPPFTKLDILSCRNLLIYLSPDLQKKLIPLFHYSLNTAGILVLGSAETIGSYTGHFVSIDSKMRVYRRLEGGTGSALVEFPAAFAKKVPNASGDGQVEALPFMMPSPNLQALAEHVLVQRFAPAALLTSDKGDILYVSGRTGKYLEPAIGKASMNIFAMARDGLRLELSSAFSAALREDRVVTVRGIKIGSNGDTFSVDLTVQRLAEPKELRGTVIVALVDSVSNEPEKVAMRRNPAGLRSAHLEHELQRAHDEIQTTREEMQTSQEELKSTNEELQSTNEELQSTNEELTTSKEEMQSMNEELQTVNYELQSKVDELSRANNDMKNLLNSTDIATLFLDGDLLVRRFTTPTASIIKLIPSDAGRPISDIAREIDYPELTDDAHEVLRTLIFKERLVAGTQGRWFSVRIMPYRTLENVIDGVVITFTDASATKTMEATLREQTSELRQMMESLPDLVWGCQADGACDYLSRQWLHYTGAAHAELQGYGWLHAVHADDREATRQEWRAAVKAGIPLDVDLRLRAKDGSYRWFKLRATAIHGSQGDVVKWYGTGSDIHDLMLAAEQRAQNARELARLLDHIDQPFFILGDAQKVTYANAGAEALVGRSQTDVLGRPLAELVPELSQPLVDSGSARALVEGDRQSFDVRLKKASNEMFEVSLVPNAGGVAVIFQRQEDGRATREGRDGPRGGRDE